MQSPRADVLSSLHRLVGFPFSEAELSPRLRKRIGDISEVKLQQDQKRLEISQLMKTRSEYESNATILAVTIIGGIYYYRKMKQADEEIRRTSHAIDDLSKTLDPELAAISKEVYSELSLIHEMRTKILGATAPTQLVKETVVKEIVMVPCAYCRGLMPQTSLYCPTCGAQRKG